MLQRIEPVVPVVGEGGEELLGELDRCGPQAVADPAALARLGRDEAGVGHEGEVFGDRLARDRQAGRQVGDRGWPVGGQGSEDGAAGRVGQRDEDLLGYRFDVRRSAS